MRERLGPNEAVVFLFVSPKGSYGFLIRRQAALLIYPIPLDEAEIAGSVTKLRESTVESPADCQTSICYRYKLYAALFGPVEKDLEGVSALSVAATGDLLRFPLAALVTQPGISASNGDYRAVPWLVRRVALSYFPSPRIFVNLRRERWRFERSAAVHRFWRFPPAVKAQLAATFPPDRCREDFRALSGLESLPDTKAEVNAIGTRLGAGASEIILGESSPRRE